jgi:hypothetical protein
MMNYILPVEEVLDACPCRNAVEKPIKCGSLTKKIPNASSSSTKIHLFELYHICEKCVLNNC